MAFPQAKLHAEHRGFACRAQLGSLYQPVWPRPGKKPCAHSLVCRSRVLTHRATDLMKKNTYPGLYSTSLLWCVCGIKDNELLCCPKGTEGPFLWKMCLYMDQRGTTTLERGCNNMYNEMSPDIILDHIPIARGHLLVQSRDRRQRNWSVHLLRVCVWRSFIF